MRIPFQANNGQAHTGAGVISGAYAMKSNTMGLNQAVGQGLANGSLDPSEHAQIHSERMQIKGLREQAAQNGASPQERAQIRQEQRQVYSQIQAFESN